MPTDAGPAIPATNNIVAAGLAYNAIDMQTVLGSFTSSGTFMQGRQQATGVILGNNVYVIGGADGAGTFNPIGSIEQATIQ